MGDPTFVRACFYYQMHLQKSLKLDFIRYPTAIVPGATTTIVLDVLNNGHAILCKKMLFSVDDSGIEIYRVRYLGSIADIHSAPIIQLVQLLPGKHKHS